MIDIDFKDIEINIVGDTHNIESLKNILNKFANIISLGDIGAAVPKDIFKEGKLDRYRKVWRYFSKKEGEVKPEDVDWFKSLNINSWKTQIDNIVKSKKKFILNFGNSDVAMTSFFAECEDYLTQNLNENFRVIRTPEIVLINNIQLLFIPFQKDKVEVGKLLQKIKQDKRLFVLTHCPPLKEARKGYYVNNYEILKEISKKYPQEITLIHGHMHPSNSYKYSIETLPNVLAMSPKAEETLEGFGINNQVIQLNTVTGKILLVDSITSEKVEFRELPGRYRTNEDHWNEFDENGNK